ncbi:MAG: hypothetical protein LC808_35580, partial [Actinobacteria bacterium]|nr:hypothetical protein [Actinomycetota bacterium]
EAVGTDVVTPSSPQGADAHRKTGNRRSEGAPPGTRTPNPLIENHLIHYLPLSAPVLVSSRLLDTRS